ncbi:MAG: ABC transporter ATP-binding protein [Deltaproteobacteria bacterium]|nr:ABC transporter ATP-binding protein [Deltaproteobacteria bacterium]
MLLELDGVNKFYGPVHALRDVSLRLAPGSIGLLGPNGAGKSTLLKILLGLLSPTGGRAQVLGCDPTGRSLDLRQRIGYMPEQDCYIAGLDAVETCSYAAQLCGLPPADAKERAHAVLEYVGLGDKRYLKVQGYSTGQKQRVKLAQALVHDPDLLLLDEPTNGLDPQGRDEMLALITQLPARRSCSIMLSSHLLPDVEEVCDQVIVIAEGQVRFSGPLAELRGTQDGYYEVRVKADADRLRTLLDAAGCQALVEDGLLKVRLPPGADPDLIFRTALDAQIQVRHLARCELSLEAAFIAVLERKGAA